MAIVNKFILQGESKQLIEELNKAENAYEQHLQTIKETTTKINENEKAQIQATKNIAKYGKSSQSAQLEAQKEILAGLKLERRELNLYKKELTEKNAIYKKEIASIKQKSKAKDKEVKEWIKGTEKELQAEKELDRAMDNISKKSEIRNDKARVASIQKQLQNERELKSLKDTLLVYSKAEQVERKYTQLQTESLQAYKNGIITKDQYISSTKNLTKAQKEEVQSANDGTNALVRKLRQMETLIVGFYALKTAYDATMGRGHEFNKLIESETIGLKLLIAQNLANVDAMGRAVTAQEKFNYAQVEAEKAMRMVRDINVQTPHTLAETLQIYKLITPQVMKYGGELEDVGKITKNVSVMASAMGIEFQQLLKTVDSLMSGQMNESGLKRAMEQFGITQKEVNKTIEAGGDVVELFIDKLKQVDPASEEIAKTWAGITAQFINKYDELWSELQKPLFESMKVGIKDATEFMKEHGEQIKWVVGNLDNLAVATVSAYTAYKVMTTTSSVLQNRTMLLSKTLKAMPLLAVASGVAWLATQLWSAKEASDAMRRSATLTIAELKKMDIARLKSNNVLISSAIKKKKIEIAGLASDVRGADGYSIAGVSILKMSKEELAVAEEKLATAKEEMAELRKQKQVIREIATEKKTSNKASDYRKYKDEVAHLKQIKESLTSLDVSKLKGSAVDQKVYKTRVENLTKEYLATEKLIAKDKERYKGYTAPKDPNRILANPNLNDKLVENAKQYNDTQTPKKVKLNKTIIEQKKEIAKLDKLINDDNNKNEINRSKWIESRSILQKSIKNEEAEILELGKKGAKSSSSRARTEKSRAKTLENNLAKQLALEYALAKQHIKIDTLQAQLNGKALTKVEIIKKELALLHTKDSLEKSAKNANDHKINILNKELALKRAIVDEEEKLSKYNSDIKKSIFEAKAKATQKKVDAEKLYQELLGNKSYAENIEYWKLKNKLQQGGIDLTIEEIKLLKNPPHGFKEGVADAFNYDKNLKLKDAVEELGYRVGYALRGVADGILDNMKSGQSVSSATTNALNDTASGVYDDMKNSSNPYVAGVGYAIDAIEALGSTFEELTVNEHIDNRSISDSLTVLNDVMFPHLEHTKKMSAHLENMDKNFNSMASNVLFGKGDISGKDYTNYEGGLGDKLGSITGNDFVDGLLGGIGSFISGKSVTLENAGILLGEQAVDSLSEGVDAEAFKYERVKRSFLGVKYSDKGKYSTSELDNALKNDLDAIFEDGYQSIVESAKSLDIKNFQTQLDSVVLEEMKLDLKGKSEAEIKEAISNSVGYRFSAMTEGAVNGALDGFRRTGEEYYTTLLRTSVGYEQAGEALKRLHIDAVKFTDIKNQSGDVTTETIRDSIVIYRTAIDSQLTGISDLVGGYRGSADGLITLYTELDTFQFQLQNIGMSVREVNQEMIDGAGDLKTLSSGQNAYIENFFSDSEKSVLAINSLNREFEAINATMPESKEQFRQLLESTTDSKKYGELIALVDDYARVNELKVAGKKDEMKLIEDEMKLIGDKINKNKALNDSYQTFIDSLDFSDLDYRTGQEKTDLAKSNYLQSGSMEDARRYLENAKETSLNRYDYAFKYNTVKQDFKEKIQNPKYDSDGGMLISSPALEKRYDDLEKKFDKLNESTENASKAEIEELKAMLQEFKDMRKENKENTETLADATERASHQKAG